MLEPTYDETKEAYVLSEAHRLRFNCNHDGSFTALVPVQVPNSGAQGDARSFVSLVPIRLEAETTSNKKGMRRIMLKASLPYNAVNSDSAATGTDESRFDPARSGGTISAHFVVSIPRACETDIKGVRGTTAQRVAQSQVAGAVLLLGTLLNDTLLQSAGAYACDAGGAPGTLDLSVEGLGATIAASGVKTVVTGNTSRPLTGMRISDNLAGFTGQAGLDLTSLGDWFARVGSPLLRGLMGQSPLAEDETVEMPSIVTSVPL
jgi:hypothetical protein